MLLNGIDWLAIGLFFAALFGIALVKPYIRKGCEF